MNLELAADVCLDNPCKQATLIDQSLLASIVPLMLGLASSCGEGSGAAVTSQHNGGKAEQAWASSAEDARR